MIEANIIFQRVIIQGEKRKCRLERFYRRASYSHVFTSRVCWFAHVSVVAFHGDPWQWLTKSLQSHVGSVGLPPRYTNPLSKWARFLLELVFILLLEFLSSPQLFSFARSFIHSFPLPLMPRITDKLDTFMRTVTFVNGK